MLSVSETKERKHYAFTFPRGAKLCVVKTQRKAKQAETLTQDYIITRKLLAGLFTIHLSALV